MIKNVVKLDEIRVQYTAIRVAILGFASALALGGCGGEPSPDATLSSPSVGTAAETFTSNMPATSVASDTSVAPVTSVTSNTSDTSETGAVDPTLQPDRSFTVSAGATSAAIDAVIAAMPPNSWKSLPNTPMKEVCPLPYYAYACRTVTAAWGGGAYDAARDRMIIYGGGHADSWYNNVFAFDLPTMKWYRLSEMADGGNGAAAPAAWRDRRLESCGFYPKGPVTLPDSVMNGAYVAYDKCFVEPVVSQLNLQQPRSIHTYGALFVDRLRDRYCAIGTGTYYPSATTNSPVVVCFDPRTKLWSRAADKPKGVGGRGQIALDSSGNAWALAAEAGFIGKYDPTANSWKTYGRNNYDAGGGTDIDRKRNHLYVLYRNKDLQHVMRRWDLTSPASLTATKPYTEVATTGDLPTGLGSRPGFVYADAHDQFYTWGGGRDVYTWHPVTKVWTRHAATGDDPGPQLKWGTYGRFRYSPTRNVFVLVNDATQNVYIYKPPY